MKDSVAVAKEATAKKDFSPAKSDISIHHAQNEPERQLASLRGVIGNIRTDGDTPSVDSIATHLNSMHTRERAPVLLALQQTHGNRYVQQVVARIQAKLVVGQPGNIYEHEADRVAEAVMRMPIEPEVEEMLHVTPYGEAIIPLVQRSIGPQEEDILHEDEAGVIQSFNGTGHPRSASDIAFFEPRLGRDLSQVRIHTDKQAAQAVNARAFTVGNDIVFGVGQYAPGTTAGRQMLAHELTHVVQQSDGGHGLNSAPTSIQRLVHESEFFVNGTFIEIDYDNTQVSDDQVRQLLQSLDLLPPTHLPHVPIITVGNRPPQGGGGSAHSGMPGGPYIRLNRSCFNSSWNSGNNNETLLHEVGHIVDWAFDCMRHMRIDNPEGYRALLRHPHRGRTQGPGEHFADAYAHHYMGRQISDERRNALLTSRAYQM